MILEKNHINILTQSAINEDVYLKYCKSILEVDDVPSEFSSMLSFVNKNLPALLFKLQTINGKSIPVLRPDTPKDFEGKYILPKESSGIYYISNILSETPNRVVIIEGIKQFLAGVSCEPKNTLVLGLNGCYGWSKDGVARNELNNLKIDTNTDFFICLDADIESNLNVWEAGIKLKQHLEAVYGGKIKFVKIPAGKKTGLDDYLSTIPENNRAKVFENLLSKASSKIPKKPLKSKDLTSKSETKDLFEVNKEVSKNIPEQFFKPNLLDNIYEEINKFHKKDDKEKVALFIIRTTAELKSEGDRCSVALKGESSSGKDNAIKTIFDLFPDEDSFILTRGTQSALEEKSNEVKSIAFSEINANRDNGANKDLTEFFKQLSEGGCRVIKRDKNTNEILDLKSEQKSLFYGTTETETDDELQTRYVIIPIRSNKQKNRIVIDDVLSSVSTPFNLLNKIKKSNWIEDGIKNLDHDVEVVIPFADLLKSPIKDTDGKTKFFFDETKDRVKRDIKRLMSLTKAVTWLHQKQRHIEEYKGTKFVFAEPCDFLIVIQLFAEFFNLTYNGLDHRLQTCYETIKELEGKHTKEILSHGFSVKHSDWVLRHKLAEELGISSVNTIKDRIKILKDHQLIETFYDNSINNKGYLIKSSGYQSGVNRVSLPVSLIAIDTHLIGSLTPSKIQEIYHKENLSHITLKFLENRHDTPIFSEKLTPVKLTPSKRQIEIASIDELKSKFSENKKIVLSSFENCDNILDITNWINKLIHDGFIFESKKGILEMVK